MGNFQDRAEHRVEKPSADGARDAPSPRPRVLMLGMSWFGANPGGLDRYYRSLYEQLPEASGVVVGPTEGAPGSLTLAAREDNPLPWRMLRYWLGARRALADVELLDTHFALYAAPLLLLGHRRLPSVFHFHGPWAEEHVAAGDGSQARYAVRRGLERAVLRRADAHVVLSSAFRRVLIERYGVPPWGIRVWAPGVELDAFTPGERMAARAKLGIGAQAFAVVCVRRLVPRMGIDVLLDAWEQIVPELPSGSVLLIAGEGPLRSQIEARAAQIEHGSVRVLGRISDSELVELYRAGDVAAVPTLSIEGFGLVVLEAAACGTPSVVSAVGGLPEVIRALDPSLLVAPGDPPALAKRLRRAARGELPSRERTRSYAEAFSWPVVAERHRELYADLAAGRRDERPRVVYLDHIARLSGGEIALLRLLPHMGGVNAHVILGEDGPLAERLTQAGISVEILPIAPSTRDLRKDTVRFGGVSPLAALHTLAYVFRLALRLRRLRPDLVHTNSLKAGVYGALAARAAGVPLLWHARDRIADDYIPKPAVRLVRALVRHLATGVLANSEATLSTLPETRSRALREVIPDSVEPSTHPPIVAMGSTTFGMLGRIAPWKGQDLFLRAFAAAFPAGQERAVVVGAPLFGEEDYERELHELAHELGIAERVEFRGFREDIWPELASFDVLVHASVIPEPFGQVVLEGMAAGLPVLAPDEGGPASVIEDGKTGRLFRSRERDSLAAAMRSLSVDRGERERLGAGARCAVESYRPEHLADRIEQLYDRLLERS
ncbi:MAG TPA: glycosyltransferase family 4 protein [Solirubrobacteraceae bacterium]|nr:glycosyltransferase family 4 protein [Solirubrobacteraceae bacterium]